MNLIGFSFLVVAAIALLSVPRRWAPLPLMAGACYMTLGQGIEIGPFNFTLVRLLLLVGLVRVLTRGERPAGGLLGMDKLMLAWAAWALFCPVFRQDPLDTLIFHLGRSYTYLGLYFLLRCFCQEWEDVLGLVKMTALMLVPVALEMLSEQFTSHNLFSALGGVDADPAVRNGRLRSQGPFGHAILAGTVGAVCAPLMIGLWRFDRRIAALGLGACLLMVVSSASSGPLMSVIFGAFALFLWRWRHLTKQMRIAAVLGYILLDIVMKAPAYYLIARIDVTGSSSSYHRAAIIGAGIEYFNEWWLAGTDYTRHWMAYGVSWSPDHADITNHYLAQGVMGGLMLMMLFIAIVGCGFRYVGQALRDNEDASWNDRFLMWSLGCALFAHATTCISVAYFDQSIFFLYMTLALTATLQTGAPATEGQEDEELDTIDGGQDASVLSDGRTVVALR